MNRQLILRRTKSIGAVLLMLVLLTPLMPLGVILGALLGLVRRTNFVALRLLVFGWIYLLGEVAGVFLSGAILLVSRRGSRRFLDLNYRLQAWWAMFLFKWMARLLSLSFEVEGGENIEPGPVIVFMRHASIIDNLLPAVFITKPHGLRLRYVLKQELLSDPALDIVGNRLPNLFVDRVGGDDEQIEQLRGLVRGLGPSEGALIYPEGTRFTRKKRAAVLEKLAGSPYFERAAALNRVLPPRVGGPLALLEGAPEADVIICAHRGLEGFATVGEILSGRLVGATVSVNFRRVPRSDIPAGRREQIDWLYSEWSRVDEEVAG